jgi:heme/copper-type cytochrome/quinol oxidase subunit 2
MYCPACGVAVVQGLSFCNYCGAKLNEVKGDPPTRASEVKAESLVAAMVIVFVLGMVVITMLMGVMKTVLNLNVGLILGFILLSFLIMLSIEGVLVRLLFRRRHGFEESGDAVQLKGQGTKELDVAQARGLPEHMPSVTEHTTRAFDPIYKERTLK